MLRTLLWYSPVSVVLTLFSRAGVCVCHVAYALPARTPSLRERDTYNSEREACHPEEKTRTDPELSPTGPGNYAGYWRRCVRAHNLASPITDIPAVQGVLCTEPTIMDSP